MGQKPTAFQAQVAFFLGGYLGKERQLENGHTGKDVEDGPNRVEDAICLPGIPQQETSHDCGFFILEQILRALQLSPKALRELASATSFEIAMLPWPSQKQVLSRKVKLRESLTALFNAARVKGTGDVEVLLRGEEKLRFQIRSALTEGGPSFQKGFERWAAGDWDLSPSPYRSESRSKKRSKQKARSESSQSGSGRRDRKRRKTRRETSSSSGTRRRNRRSRS